MAIRNPYWGKQKGKLGETVLAVVKGQQVQRAYNAEPVNPRTRKQTNQRMIFASAVKFFKSAIDQQFKFAYEDRTQKESDYNAFMRHNIGISLPTTQEALAQANFMPFAPYLVSNGSIPEVPCRVTGNKNHYYDAGTTLFSVPATLQQTADQFKQGLGLIDGDIITILYLATNLTTYKGTPIGAPKWNIVQIKVGDTTDTRDWTSVSHASYITGETTGIAIVPDGTTACMTGLIISRPTPKGLKVSTCHLQMNSVATTQYNRAHGLSALNELATQWGAQKEAVLEGSELPAVQ